MEDWEKKEYSSWGKSLIFGLLCFIACIALAGTLNAVVDGLESFYGWIAGVNFLAEGYLLFNLYKKFFKKNK